MCNVYIVAEVCFTPAVFFNEYLITNIFKFVTISVAACLMKPSVCHNVLVAISRFM